MTLYYTTRVVAPLKGKNQKIISVSILWELNSLGTIWLIPKNFSSYIKSDLYSFKGTGNHKKRFSKNN